MRILPISLLVIALSACATTQSHSTQSANNMKGASKSTLIHSWGAPDVTTTAPNGNTQLIYLTQNYQTYPSSPSTGVQTVTTANGLPIVIATPPTQTTQKIPGTKCSVIFEVNQHNMVVSSTTKGCY